MAFPGTYNFSYYKGDTLEFNIYPKTANGDPFDLTDFDNAVFTAARSRGVSEENLINLFAQFDPTKQYITCRILPATGLSFVADNTPYIYDIQINNGSNIVYTLLTGQITITEQISPNPEPEIIVTIPNAPTNLALTESPQGTINASWTAPATGDAPTQYKIYGKAPSATPVPITDYIQFATVNHPTTTFSADSVTILNTEYPLIPGVEYFIKVTASNTAGENTTSFVEDSIVLSVPETIPGTVGNLTISARDIMAGTATLTWTAPTSGAAVTSYVVGYNDNPQITDTPLDFVPIMPPLSAETLTYSFTTELTPATPYAFAVIAYAADQAGTPAVVVDEAP